jgi:hypothetical protein
VESQISFTSEPDCLDTEQTPREGAAEGVAVSFAVVARVDVSDAKEAAFAAATPEAKETVAGDGGVEAGASCCANDWAKENGESISTQRRRMTNAEKPFEPGLPEGHIQYRIILWAV